MGRKSKLLDKEQDLDNIEKPVEKKPKEKRRNSEKRKEKSRDAARCRRSKESEIFTDLANTLPVPSNVINHMDKASVMRLAIAYLKIRHILGTDASETEFGKDNYDNFLMRAMDGFLLVVSREGDIVYVSENISQYLGLCQMDLLGQPLLEFSHPCDHEELKEILSIHKSEDESANLSRSFFLRMKCTLTTKGRSVNLKSATYKVIHLTGHVIETGNKTEEKTDGHSLIVIGEPVPHPFRNEALDDSKALTTKHSMDFKFTSVDKSVGKYFGYASVDLEGKSLLDFYHILDGEAIGKTLKTLIAKGQVVTGCYRFLAKHGGFVWTKTQATVVHGPKDGKPQQIICVHYVLSGIEEPDQILSLSQLSSKCESNKENVVTNKKRVAPENIQIPNAATSGSFEKRSILPLGASDLPKVTTADIFVAKTKDMDFGFLGFDERNDCFTMLKEEPEDLTFLAPSAGDVCVPLPVPCSLSLNSHFDVKKAPTSGKDLECLPLTAFEFPGFDFLESAREAGIKRRSLSEASSSKRKVDFGRIPSYSPISEDEGHQSDLRIGMVADALQNKGDLLDLIEDGRGLKRKKLEIESCFAFPSLALERPYLAQDPIIKDMQLFSSSRNDSPLSPMMANVEYDDHEPTKVDSPYSSAFVLHSVPDMENQAAPIEETISDEEEDMNYRAPMISMFEEVPLMNMWDIPGFDSMSGTSREAVDDQMPAMDPYSKVQAGLVDNVIDNNAKSSLFSLLMNENHAGRLEPGSRPAFKKMIPEKQQLRSEMNSIKKRKVCDSLLLPKRDFQSPVLVNDELMLCEKASPNRVSPPVNDHAISSHGSQFYCPSDAFKLSADPRQESVLLNLLVSGIDAKEGYVCSPLLQDKTGGRMESFNFSGNAANGTVPKEMIEPRGPIKTIIRVPKKYQKRFQL
ncbi:uncharacterized protein LOC136029228 isoform X2 [Artemia franciscana]|uniref:uncharacterized protein LOC136029228 isoform X2 n=1 Tax=Artemia franciscana TaxID=6661 RepID=UPI0032DAE195